MPNGKEYYEFLARSYTTTNLTPKEIHEKGLSEVKRIRAEMEKIKTQVGFKGTLQEFFDFSANRSEIFLQNARRIIKWLIARSQNELIPKSPKSSARCRECLTA